MASAFSTVSGGRRIALRRSSSELNPPAGHFCTWKTWAPSTLISFSMVACTTEIAVITAMIDATPATMPTRVRTERSLLLTNRPQGHGEGVKQTHGAAPVPDATHSAAPRWDRAARRGRPAPGRPPRPTAMETTTAVTRMGIDTLAGISTLLITAVSDRGHQRCRSARPAGRWRPTRTGTASGCCGAWRRWPCGCRSPGCAR